MATATFSGSTNSMGFGRIKDSLRLLVKSNPYKGISWSCYALSKTISPSLPQQILTWHIHHIFKDNPWWQKSDFIELDRKSYSWSHFQFLNLPVGQHKLRFLESLENWKKILSRPCWVPIFPTIWRQKIGLGWQSQDLKGYFLPGSASQNFLSLPTEADLLQHLSGLAHLLSFGKHVLWPDVTRG